MPLAKVTRVLPQMPRAGAWHTAFLDREHHSGAPTAPGILKRQRNIHMNPIHRSRLGRRRRMVVHRDPVHQFLRRGMNGFIGLDNGYGKRLACTRHKRGCDLLKGGFGGRDKMASIHTFILLRMTLHALGQKQPAQGLRHNSTCSQYTTTASEKQKNSHPS